MTTGPLILIEAPWGMVTHKTATGEDCWLMAPAALCLHGYAVRWREEPEDAA